MNDKLSIKKTAAKMDCNVFIKNNLPMVGKVYSCFEILHPNMNNEIEYFPTVSPILKSSSLLGDKAIIFFRFN